MAGVQIERGAAKLVIKDGAVRCECPYACLATYEACEFSKAEWDAARPQPKKRWWKR